MVDWSEAATDGSIALFGHYCLLEDREGMEEARVAKDWWSVVSYSVKVLSLVTIGNETRMMGQSKQ